MLHANWSCPTLQLPQQSTPPPEVSCPPGLKCPRVQRPQGSSAPGFKGPRVQGPHNPLQVPLPMQPTLSLYFWMKSVHKQNLPAAERGPDMVSMQLVVPGRPAQGKLPGRQASNSAAAAAAAAAYLLNSCGHQCMQHP